MALKPEIPSLALAEEGSEPLRYQEPVEVGREVALVHG